MSVKGATREAANKPWVERAARIGLAVRGVVFVVLAYLVARIASGALGEGGTKNAASGSGVAKAVAEQNGGDVMVFLLGVGLAFYAMFSLLDATLHHDEKSSDAKRWAALAHGLWRTAVYAVFSVYALYTAFNGQSDSGSSRHENAKQSHWSARVLSWPAGWLWLGALGVALLAGAAYLVSTAVRRSFRKRLKQDEMTPRAWRIATVSGVAGHLGRAALYALAGWFITSAAVENDPSNGHGLDGSARDFANNAGGAALLYVVAAALVAFGVYMWCEARYRRV